MTIGEVHFTCFEHVGALFYHLWHPFIIASDCSWTMNITSSLNYPHCSIFGIDVKFSLLFIIVDEMYKNVIIVNIFISNFVTKRLPLAELHYFSIRFIKGSICTSNDANKPPPKKYLYECNLHAAVPDLAGVSQSAVLYGGCTIYVT